LNNDGQIDSLREAGAYRFSNVTPGSHHVKEVLTPGFAQTTGPAIVTLVSGQTSSGNDLGNRSASEIRGTKWNDLNADGASAPPARWASPA
jgi:hypothetical protein